MIEIKRSKDLIDKQQKILEDAVFSLFQQSKDRIIARAVAGYAAMVKSEDPVDKPEGEFSWLDHYLDASVFRNWTAIIRVAEDTTQAAAEDGIQQTAAQLSGLRPASVPVNSPNTTQPPTSSNTAEEGATTSVKPETGVSVGIKPETVTPGDAETQLKNIIEIATKKTNEQIHSRVAELVGKKYKDGVWIDNPNAKWAITDGTRTLIRADIELAYKEGWASKQLSDRLKLNYAFSEERAQTIARTEILRADSYGQLAVYRASGVVTGKEWSPDAEACPICVLNANEGVIPLEQLFLSGDLMSPAHPRCECSVNPVVDELEVDE